MASGNRPLTTRTPPRSATSRARRVREPAVRALVAVVFALLALFVLYPLVMVLRATFVQNGAWTLDVYRELLGSRAFLTPLRNSLLLGATVAVTGTFVGFATAYALTMTSLRGGRVFRTIATIPMIAPPFMIALAAIMLLGRNGVITRTILRPLFGDVPDIYGYGGLVLVQTLTYFPVAMLVLVGTLAAIDPVLEEAAESQGASSARVFRDVVLPLSVPGILSAMLLLFIESLADFGNPLILGGDFQVLSVAAFLRITGQYDTAGGAVLATLLLVPALVAFHVQRRYVARTAVATLTGRPSPSRRRSGAASRAFGLVTCGIIGAAVCLFFGAVVYGSLVDVWGAATRFTLANYTGALIGARAALSDSLLLAAIATPLTGILGMAVAWLITRRTFTGRNFLATLAMLTFAVPGTVVGIGYILAFNRAPLALTGTAAIIVLLFIFRNAPVGIEAGTSALRQIDPAIEEGSASLGASPLSGFLRVVLPLITPAFFTGLAHAFIRSMTAISAVIFVVSGQWNLITVSILGFVENSDLARASALCMILIIIVSAVLALLQLALAHHARITGAA